MSIVRCSSFVGIGEMWWRGVVLGLLVLGARGAPLPKTRMPTGKALDFMQRFGYLEKGDGHSDALYSEEGVANAIKLMQKFGNIEQTGVLDEATLKLMISKRCGVPDILKNRRTKRFALGPSGWNKRRITYFIANWSPTLGEFAVMKNIQTALDAWGKYARLTFHRTTDGNGDIVVAFGSGYHGDSFPFDGPGNVLAHAFFPSEGSFGGDIHFDNDEKWINRQPGDPEDGTDFFTVAVHELGHSLGLSHSSNPSSIMFPYYKGYDAETQFNLDYDDILGIYELYIRRYIGGDEELPDEFDTTTHRHITTTTPVTTTTTTTTPPSTTIRIYTETPPTANVTITYEGDYESVETHKTHETTFRPSPTTITTTHSPSTVPNICDGHFDAVATLRNELFIFKGPYMWRLRDKFQVLPNYPAPIRQMFPRLPTDVESVDAAYERPDGNIVLFTGNRFWVYDGDDFTEGSPRPLTDYGLPDYVDSIDAVQIWAKNSKTYIYKGDRFWRYNETRKTIDPGYPRHIERWRGVPENLDAATTWKDGYTYFFKDKLFWKFDNDWIIVTDSSPLPSPQTWLGCPEDMETSWRFRGN